MDELKRALKGQFHGALAMLMEAIELCPDELWAPAGQFRSFYRISYHTLYFTALYCETRAEDFVPWERHRSDVEGDQHTERLDAVPYTKAEILQYWGIVDGLIDSKVDSLDLSASESGFSWYKIPKLDHVLVNLRHIQEHAGGLRDRLIELGLDPRWVARA